MGQSNDSQFSISGKITSRERGSSRPAILFDIGSFTRWLEEKKELLFIIIIMGRANSLRTVVHRRNVKKYSIRMFLHALFDKRTICIYESVFLYSELTDNRRSDVNVIWYLSAVHSVYCNYAISMKQKIASKWFYLRMFWFGSYIRGIYFQ